jgi:hypothetical protein
MKSLKVLLLSAIFLPPNLQALTLQWNANPTSEQISSYELCVYVSNASSYSIINVGNTTQYNITPVLNARTTYWVRAINSTAIGYWSTSVTYDPNVAIPFIKVSSYTVVLNPATQARTATLNLSGTPALAFSVETSENLLVWTSVFTGQIAANGTYSFQNVSTKPKLFYRTKYNQ